VVVIQPPAGMFESENDKWQRYSQTVQAWVQVTQIGVDAYTDASDMVVWATDLKNGAPWRVSAFNPTRAVPHSDRSGWHGTLAHPSRRNLPAGQPGADQAMLLHSPYYWDDSGWDPAHLPTLCAGPCSMTARCIAPGKRSTSKAGLRRVGANRAGMSAWWGCS